MRGNARAFILDVAVADPTSSIENLRPETSDDVGYLRIGLTQKQRGRYAIRKHCKSLPSASGQVLAETGISRRAALDHIHHINTLLPSAVDLSDLRKRGRNQRDIDVAFALLVQHNFW